jgi:hypothetical protein
LSSLAAASYDDRMLRACAIVGVVACGLLAPGSESSARSKKKPKASLTCAVTYADGSREVLDGSDKLRIDGVPVTCMLVVTELDDTIGWEGKVWTRFRTIDADTEKPVDVDGPEQTGEVYYRADAFAALLATFNPDTDYLGCQDFVINAALADPHGGTVWKGQLKVEQECPE